MGIPAQEGRTSMMTATLPRLGLEVRRIQGERIRKARIWVSLTQKELAAEVSWLIDNSISHNIISQIEQGERDVTTREMRAIAYVTGQPREWLEGEGGEFDPTVTAATLNLVIPGYDNRQWSELIDPSAERVLVDLAAVS